MKRESAQKPDKNSRAYLEGQVRYARNMVLIILLMTLINLVFLLLEYDRYFLFSASVPYYGVALARIFELDMTLPLVLAVVIMAGYLICWLLAKKKSGAITAALVLFCLDTLALLGIAFGVMESPLVNLLDLVFHVIGIIALAQGVAAGAKLKNLPPEQVPEAPSADGIRYL